MPPFIGPAACSLHIKFFDVPQHECSVLLPCSNAPHPTHSFFDWPVPLASPPDLTSPASCLLAGGACFTSATPQVETLTSEVRDCRVEIDALLSDNVVLAEQVDLYGNVLVELQKVAHALVFIRAQNAQHAVTGHI